MTGKNKSMANQSMFVLTQAQFSAHSSCICELIHLGRKITLVCGAGVSTAAGISVSLEAIIYGLDCPFPKLVASLVDVFLFLIRTLGPKMDYTHKSSASMG